MSELYIIRGLPGAGKSRFVSSLNAVNIDDDTFYTRTDGTYRFHHTLLLNCRTWMIYACNDYMSDGVDISLTSVFETDEHTAPFIKLANKYKYNITQLIIENIHGNKSIHNVPDNQLDIMRETFTIKLR